MRQLKLFSMSFLCLIASLAAGALLLEEVKVLLQPQRSDAIFFGHIASGVPQHGLSSYSKKIALGDCTFALLNTERAADREQASAVARSCERLSRDIVETMPTNSQAWYVHALAKARLGQTESFLASYRRSRATGPNEQWLAENRARLAEEMFPALDSESRRDHEADLTLLANSRRGTRTLAERYAVDESFRERIVTIVSRLSPERQRAFLNNVRQVLR